MRCHIAKVGVDEGDTKSSDKAYGGFVMACARRQAAVRAFLKEFYST